MTAGRGGEEARLFAADVYRAIDRFLAARGGRCQVTVVEVRREGKGLRRAGLLVRARESTLAHLRAQVGEHICQRITRSRRKDRIHTSSAWVAALTVSSCAAVFDPAEVVIDAFRGSGPGGQHRNKVATAIRARHRPTGEEAVISSGRSQAQNRAMALRILSARVAARAQVSVAEDRRRERAGQRKPLRTYDFVRGVIRCRDGTRTGRLAEVMDGKLELLG